jgi:ligand-binding sensor domain-containing protein/two-component sensor histidine kinase
VARAHEGTRLSPAFCRRIVATAVLILIHAGGTRGERLPLGTYTIADGLARDQVLRIVMDSRGFLWFCTFEGLSRFDGHTFVNYTTVEGLPHRSIRDLLQTRSGAYWIATGAGVVRLNLEASRVPTARAAHTRGTSLFTVYHPAGGDAARSIQRLYEDRSGRVWAGTRAGLYRLNDQGAVVTFRFMDLGMPARTMDDTWVEDILEARDGTLWVGTRGSGLYRLRGDKTVERYTTAQGLPFDRVNVLLEDRTGRLWAGTPVGLVQLVDRPTPQAIVVARSYSTGDGLPGRWITGLLQSADGTLWIGTNEGLGAIHSPGPPEVKAYTRAQGLSDREVSPQVEDHDGNIWIRTGSRGALKLVRGGFITYDENDGLGNPVVGSIFQDQSGDLHVFGNDRLARFDGHRFLPVRLELGKTEHFAWGSGQTALQDRSGSWWFATRVGLFRFPKVRQAEDLAHVRPEAIYTTANGLPGNDVFHVFEDRQNGIWVETLSALEPNLSRWEPATQTFRRFSDRDGWPAGTWVNSFGEDAAGNVWMGTDKGLARLQGGRFRFFTTADGLPTNAVGPVHLDPTGALWVATDSAGVFRIEDPASERLRIRSYTMATGLSGNQTFSATHDDWNRIYVSTGKGVDRLDPATGQIRHYSAADGLTSTGSPLAFRDRTGALWFGTNEALSRLHPEADYARVPSQAWISGVRVSGTPQSVPELGVTEMPTLELGSDERHVTIDYFGLPSAPGQALRYQYMLEGSDAGWSDPTDQRTVQYARLSPGRYRFLVRAVMPDGSTSGSPATVTFSIAPPIWFRGWFLALAGTFIVLTIYATYRYRVSRLLEIEQVRTRIATDLHDDLGASLSRVAILSEVVKRQLNDRDGRSESLLSEIADSARSLVGSLRDIVWAIDARHGSLTDVVSRVRQYASTMFDNNGIRWHLDAPDDAAAMELDPEARRHVLLFFKEGIHNIARHAGCESVELSLKRDGRELTCEVADNGGGFELAQSGLAGGDGRGLRSMQSRAVQLGGRLRIQTSAGRGTRLTMSVPLRKRSRRA